MSSKIYHALGQNGQADVIGIFAFSIYNEEKIEWAARFKVDTGSDPGPLDIEAFERTILVPKRIGLLRSAGEKLSHDFLTVAMKDKLEQLALDTRQSTLVKSFGDAVQQQMDAKLSWRGWIREAFTSLLVNIVAIFIVGILIFGIQGIDLMTDLIQVVTKLKNENKAAIPAAPNETAKSTVLDQKSVQPQVKRQVPVPKPPLIETAPPP